MSQVIKPLDYDDKVSGDQDPITKAKRSWEANYNLNGPRKNVSGTFGAFEIERSYRSSAIEIDTFSAGPDFTTVFNPQMGGRRG